MFVVSALFSDQRCYRKCLQLGLFHSADRSGKLLHAQPGPGRSKRVSPCVNYCISKSPYSVVVTPFKPFPLKPTSPRYNHSLGIVFHHYVSTFKLVSFTIKNQGVCYINIQNTFFVFFWRCFSSFFLMEVDSQVCFSHHLPLYYSCRK